MGKLRNDFDAFKDQHTELNRGVMERLHSLEVRNQNMEARLNENIQQFATTNQIRNILERFSSFDSRIKKLEDENPVDNQVSSLKIKTKIRDV
jgi:hypothetical protein